MGKRRNHIIRVTIELRIYLLSRNQKINFDETTTSHI